MICGVARPLSVILLGFGSERGRVCLWTPQNAWEMRAGSVVSLSESSEEEPGLLQTGGSLGHIYYHYWSCQLRFNTRLQMDVSGPASSLPHPSTRSQLQPHLCSFNPLISAEGRVSSEAAMGSAARAELRALPWLQHLHEPFPGEDGGSWGPRVSCKPQNKCTGAILPQSGLWEVGP